MSAAITTNQLAQLPLERRACELCSELAWALQSKSKIQPQGDSHSVEKLKHGHARRQALQHRLKPCELYHTLV